MSQPKVEISTDNRSWGNDIAVTKNQTAKVYFRITGEEASLIKLSFPVTGTDGATADSGIMEEKGWQDLTFEIEQGPKDPEDFKVQKDGTPGVTALNVNIYTEEACIFSISFKAVDKTLETHFGYGYKIKSTFFPKPVPGQFRAAIVKLPVQPEIRLFTTSSAALLTNETYDLTWNVTDYDALYIEEDGRSLKLPAAPPMKGKPSSGKKEITLTATNGTKKDGTPVYTAKSSITILGREDTGVSTVPDPFDGDLLVNLIKKDDQSLYGLVTDKRKSDVWLWESHDGITWSKTAISFNKKIPAEAACSSGIYYNNTIYLVGGSRFDSNEKSAAAYYLDANTKEWKQLTDTGFEERMGQSVVIVRDKPGDLGEIYMLGGYGHEGTLKDVHTFNPSRGWRRDFDMETPLCLHTAIFKDRQLQVLGGSTIGPSNANQKLEDARGCHILSDDKRWKSLNFQGAPQSPVLHYNIVSCTMAQCKGADFLFGIFETGSSFEIITSRVDGVKLTQAGNNAYLAAEYCSSLQAVEFKNAIWLLNVYDNNILTSSGLKYFLYQPVNPVK